ncbi:MAG: SMP-30/gluconolactonase/LRE family protein [Acidiferrobacter sp.]
MLDSVALLEIIGPAFKAFVPGNAQLEKLGEGYRWLEGPVWFADHDCLLVSDIPNDRVLRWTPSSGVTVFRQPAQFANGHTRDREGRLITCSHHDRSVTRTEPDGRLTVIAAHYRGLRLNSPNDVVVKSDGTIWFTDPPYGIETDYEGGRQKSELDAFVYRWDPRDDTLTVVADDFAGPNGLCFSPDERRLYIAETGHQFAPSPTRHIRAFDVTSDGARLTGGKIFYKVEPGFADGMRCDEDGNIWSSAGDGVHCIHPSGSLLGKIHVPSTVANLTFGGRHRSQLFLCAAHTLYAIFTNQRGAQRP